MLSSSSSRLRLHCRWRTRATRRISRARSPWTRSRKTKNSTWTMTSPRRAREGPHGDSDLSGSSSVEAPARTLSRTMPVPESPATGARVLESQSPRAREDAATHRARERTTSGAGRNSVWQRVAHQQRVERQKSLAENARLRESVEEQIKFARNLERALRKRPHLSVFGDDAATRKRDAQRQPRKYAGECCKENLHDVTAREYKRQEDVVERTGILKLPPNHRSLEVHVEDDETGDASAPSRGQIRVQLLQTYRYPF
ncbi:hypothetical protein PINS_up019754, partial [Pythium insidiosum]